MLLQKTKFNACFQLKELATLFDLKLQREKTELSFSLCTDSRSIKPEQIFLPLTGEKFDGHNFINQVLDSGVKYSFCEKDKLLKVKEKYKEKLVVVKNTLDAYHRIANYYRKKINPKVIAITGSSGKTTTKDLISSVLSKKYKTHKTEANFNNEFGVPKTILEMPEDTEMLVLELAMRARGEIKYLSKTVEPDVAVITNIGAAHIGRLGSIQEIIKSKTEMLEHLKKNGVAFFHNDQNLLQYSKTLWDGKTLAFDIKEASDISFSDGKSFFTFEGDNYSVNAQGLIHILNSILAIKIAKYFSLATTEIQKGLLNFKVPSGRGNVIKMKKDNVFLIDESYNANPDSVKAAVTNLISSWGNDYKKILILGELAELGEHENKLIGELNSWLKEKPLAAVITIGEKLKQITSCTNVKNTSECCDILSKLMLDKAVVLIKGSHVAKLDKLVEILTK
ncbi:MAG: UDP-N-acetylmuramoyl-tripeptide--D-alanyl-D-alanine ligase [Candidatus Melainabacteria bacterium]|nr:UDP-N-acetylmuramoyl-tripeptide--D-alanyl-D-alanine ligase [Candidatus Melainabacteria bacterium]